MSKNVVLPARNVRLFLLTLLQGTTCSAAARHGRFFFPASLPVLPWIKQHFPWHYSFASSVIGTVNLNHLISQYCLQVSYLKSLGGRNAQDKTSRILKHLISDNVASQFNFFGKRSNKRPFSSLRLQSCITGLFNYPLLEFCSS